MSGAPAPVSGRVLALLLITAFFTVAALAHVWVRLQVVRLGYQLSVETDREKDLQQRHRKLQVEMALLRTPERLERLASEKLRLSMPEPQVIHDLGRSAPAATRPAATRPAATRPAATRPAATRPAATRPAATRPVASRPVASRPVASRSAATRPAELTPPELTPPELTPPASSPPELTPPASSPPVAQAEREAP